MIGSMVVAVITSYVIRYRADLDAWRTALSGLDCFLFTVVILGLPIGLLIDKCMALARVRRAIRYVVMTVVGVLMGMTFLIEGSDFEVAIGLPPPPGVRILSSRQFTTPAGGGEMYIFVQFELDPEAFAELMHQGGFQKFPNEDYLTPDQQVAQFARSAEFRYPIPQITNPVFYGRSWDRPNDGTSVLWDASRRTAHARRIAG